MMIGSNQLVSIVGVELVDLYQLRVSHAGNLLSVHIERIIAGIIIIIIMMMIIIIIIIVSYSI